MKFCSKCGKEIIEETAVVCPNCGCMIAQDPASPLEDKVSVGLCVLSALIPLVGLIYWPVKHKECPKRAKACGITALIAWAVYFLCLL